LNADQSHPVLKIGKVKEAHGLKGELFILVFAKEASWAKKLKKFYLSTSQELTQFKPNDGKAYTLTTLRSIKDGLIIGTKELSDRNASEAVIGQFLYIDEGLFVAKPGERIFLREILGFEVFDQGKTIGAIESFSSNGPQDLLVVRTKSGTVEIPFVEAFIEKLDYATKKLSMNLPEGLLSLTEEE
jgi:16S rRNA processing protein RimM